MLHLGSGRRLLAGLSLSAAVALTVAACTKNVGLVVAIDSNVSVPDNIDEVGVVLADQDGNVFFSNTYTATGTARITLPAQFGVAPADSIVHVSIVGFQRSAPKVFREAIGRSPDDALAALQMGLDWEDWGSAELVPDSVAASATSVAYMKGPQGRTMVRINGKWISNVCEAGTTSVGGRCVDAHFDASKLPKYKESDVFGGEKRECFPRVACFSDQKKWIKVDTLPEVSADGRCKITVPNLPEKGSFNVGVRVDRIGEREANKKFIVIDEATPGTSGGWTRAGNVIDAPAALCEGVKLAGRLTRPLEVLISTQCATKTRKNPLCENTSSVSNPLGGIKDPVEEPVLEAGTDGGGDASPQGDAVAPPPEATFEPVTTSDGGTPGLPDGGTLYAVDMMAVPELGDGGTSVIDTVVLSVSSKSASTAPPKGFTSVYQGSGNGGVRDIHSLTTVQSDVNLGAPVGSGQYAPARLTAGGQRVTMLTPSSTSSQDVYVVYPVGGSWNSRNRTGYPLRAGVLQQDDTMFVADTNPNNGEEIAAYSFNGTVMAPAAIPTGTPFGLVGGVTGKSATGAVVPMVLFGAAGFSLPQETDTAWRATGAIAAQEYFGKLGKTLLDVNIRPAGAETPAWLLARKNEGGVYLFKKALAAGSLRDDPEQIVDGIQLDTPANGVSTTHPYAISSSGMMYYFERENETMRLVQKDILPTPHDPVHFDIKSSSTALVEIFSVAVTHTKNASGKNVDRVYVATSGAGGVGLRLLRADILL